MLLAYIMLISYDREDGDNIVMCVWLSTGFGLDYWIY
jgi:hypothetical protein